MSSNSGSRRSGRDRHSSEYWDEDSFEDDSYEYDDYRESRSSGRSSPSSRGSESSRENSRASGSSRTQGSSRSSGSSRTQGSGRSSGSSRTYGNSRSNGSSRERRDDEYARRQHSSRAAEEKRRRKREERRRKIIVIIAVVIIVLALVAAILAVTGNLGSTDYTESTMEFLESGKIRVTTVESFDQDYYDADELEETIKEAVSDYGSGVSQEYLDISDGTAKLVLLYDSAEDYVSFNDTDLFVGTVAEAREAGYDFQSIMSAVSQEDTSRILTEATLDQLLDNEVIILFEYVNVVTDEDMLYATPNLGVTDSTHATAIDDISDETPAIVILVSE